MKKDHLLSPLSNQVPPPQAGVFLRAEWRKLAMANYAVDPAILTPYLPYKTELDDWNGEHYLSLIGFMFKNTRLKGFPIPFHTNFEEVNIRFYVRHRTAQGWKRGVVFIKEIVPKPALTLVANTIYKEHYETMPMRHSWISTDEELKVSYGWKKKEWNSFSLTAQNTPHPITDNSIEDFITEHYWGYTKIGSLKTSEYEVQHPKWLVYPVKNYQINVDFEKVYGHPFGFLTSSKPASVLLAEGSEIIVRGGRIIGTN